MNRPVAVDYDDIDPSVVVQVAESRAATGCEQRLSGSGVFDFFEITVADSAHQRIWLGVGISGIELTLTILDTSICNISVQLAIVVEVNEADTESCQWQAGRAWPLWLDGVHKNTIRIHEEPVPANQMRYKRSSQPSSLMSVATTPIPASAMPSELTAQPRIMPSSVNRPLP